nr:MAG TPA: hypothetical protein [Caudoviricetes sp.]
MMIMEFYRLKRKLVKHIKQYQFSQKKVCWQTIMILLLLSNSIIIVFIRV